MFLAIHMAALYLKKYIYNTYLCVFLQLSVQDENGVYILAFFDLKIKWKRFEILLHIITTFIWLAI